MASLAEKIARLETELEERKRKRSDLDVADPLYAKRDLAYTEEIIAKEQRLKIYLESQKGKFTSPISVVLSNSYR